MPHYFYGFLESVLDQDLKFRKLLQFAMERLMFAPIFQGVSLYTLARFEGKNHNEATQNLMKLYIPVLTANWKYLSLFTLINFTVVPPMVSYRSNKYHCNYTMLTFHSFTVAGPRRQHYRLLLDRFPGPEEATVEQQAQRQVIIDVMDHRCIPLSFLLTSYDIPFYSFGWVICLNKCLGNGN